MKIPKSVLLLFTIFLVAGCYEEEMHSSKTVTESWSASEVQEIDLEGVNGSISILAGDDDEITLVAEIRARRDPDDILKLVVEDGVLRVREEHRRSKGFPFSLVRNSSAKIDYEIRVPSATVLDIETTNGPIKTEGIRGVHHLSSVNGRIEVTTPDAEITASTVNGRIVAQFTDEFRGARLKTVNGSVRVSVPPDAAISADINQVNGSFNSNIPVVVNGSKRVSRHGETREFPLDVTTVNGSVTLTEWNPNDH